MPYLQKVTITFNTHDGDDDNKDFDTLVHVFVKNRSNSTFRGEGPTDFIGNHLAYESHELIPWEINPYLARAENLAGGIEFPEGSSYTFDIPLRSAPIPIEEVLLPVVNIHILPHGDDRWIFDYTIEFLFGDGRTLSGTSNTNGVTGIILDQDNRNYSGICVENTPFVPPLLRPQTDAVLTQVCLEFHTHDDDANKDDDTQLNVHIVNRLSEYSFQDIAIGVDLLSGTEFEEGSIHRVVFGHNGLPLASNAIRLQDIVLPVVFINIGPQGNDTWIFDYQVTYTFSDGEVFTSRTSSIILNQDIHKHQGVYRGRSFPTVAPAGRPPLTDSPIVHVLPPKAISLSYLQRRFDEFINHRQGVGLQEPPIKKIRLHSTGLFGGLTPPESYYDLQSVVANPPPPGVLSPPGFFEAVKYSSSPASLGQLGFSPGFDVAQVYFNNLTNKSLSLNVDPSSSTPLSIEIDFDLSEPGKIVSDVLLLGNPAGNIVSLTVQVFLTLAFDRSKGIIDVLSWLPGITDDDQLGQYIRVGINGVFDGPVQQYIAGKIRDQLNSADAFSGKTLRDQLNATANSWLLGGIIDHPKLCGVTDHRNLSRVLGVGIDNGNLEIAYEGPSYNFVPPVPAGWPSGADFSPGNLANIDHIVVLTMENHSFDSILGYLSLPRDKGGMGRADVDGLKGTEFNLFNGMVCPSFAFLPGDTIFSPDPPHGYEPVHRAINGGRMDGFVQSYAEEHGPAVAHRIMGYYTGANVPAYDALARDFAIGQRWFASHPGPTFCNRFYELTGRLNIDPEGFWEFDNSSPLRPVFTPTIFDHLTEGKVSWKYFEHHYCFLRFFEKYTFDSEHIVAFDDPVSGFLSLAKSGNLPSVSFIDPHYIELPPGADADGPPADVQAGQQLVRKVVEAVIASPQWNKTLLIITYDEHGGFYDHVPPPAAPWVSPEPEPIRTYGVRVPAFVISPWVKAGSVFGHDGIEIGGTQGGLETQALALASGPVTGQLRSLYFDHTSILKTIARRFLSQNPPYMGARYAAAHDLSSVIGNTLHTSPFLPFIPYDFLYGPSQRRLEVQGGGLIPGAILWQNDPSDAIAQQFSFEDAGGGYVYIRTHTGNLYLTADGSLVKQEVKYPAGGGATGAHSPDRQRWKLTSSGISVLDRDHFTISNKAFPGKVLLPSGGSNNSEIPVVLAKPQPPHGGGLHRPDPWQVTSPLLPSGPIVVHP